MIFNTANTLTQLTTHTKIHTAETLHLQQLQHHIVVILWLYTFIIGGYAVIEARGDLILL